MIDLSGRIAIVTGASRGIGRGIALKLAARGAHVVAAARGENARPVVDEIAAAGGQRGCRDARRHGAGSAEALVASTLERHGRIDILVNNAGITRDQLMLRMKRDDWDAVLATNLTAAFALTQSVLKPMIRQRGGRIICISSVVGQSGNRRPGELCGIESRAHRLCEGGGARSGVPRHHGERRGAGIH